MPKTSRAKELLTQALTDMGHDGLTTSEAVELLGMSAGTVSGQLSGMNRTGMAARLNDRRNGQSVYVLPRYVNGRETIPFRGHKTEAPAPVVESDEVRAAYRRGYRDGWNDRGEG